MKKLFSFIVLLLVLCVGITLNVKMTKAEGTTTNTKVTGVRVKTAGTDYFYLQFSLSEYDYTGGEIEKSASFIVPTSTATNLGSFVLADGNPIVLNEARKDRYRATNKTFMLYVAGDPNNLPFKTVTIKAGAKFPAKSYAYDGGSESWYVTTEDITFEYNGTAFVEVKPKTNIDTEITAIEFLPRAHATRIYDGYFYIFLSNNDYPTEGNDFKAKNLWGEYMNKIKEMNLASKLEMVGKNGTTYKFSADFGGEVQVFADSNHIGAFEARILEFYTGTEYNEIKEFNVPAGTEFPSLSYLTGETTESTFYTVKENTKYVLSYTKQTGAMVYEKEEIVTAKKNAIAEANEYLNKENYREAEKNAINSKLTEYADSLNATMTLDEIATSLANVKNALDEVKTDAQLTKEENIARYTTLIDEYCDASAYDIDNQPIVEQKKLEAKNSIEACTDDSYEEIYDAYCAEIDKIETTEERILSKAKSAALEEIEVIEGTIDDYREAQAKTLLDAINEAKENVNTALNSEAIDAILSRLNGVVSSLMTDAELILDEAKQTAFFEVSDYVGETQYRDRERAKIEALINKTREKINAATSVDEVNSIVSEYKMAVNEFPTDADYVFEEYKEQLKHEIERSVDLDLYREEERSTLSAALVGVKALIDDALTTEEVDEHIRNFMMIFNNSKTNSQYEFEEYIERTLSLIPTYKSLDLFREEEKTALEILIDEFRRIIGECTTIEEAEAKVIEFQNAVDALKTDEEYKREEEAKKTTTNDTTTTKKNEESDTPSEKGCKNSIAMSFGIVLAVSSIGFIAYKKKENE